MADDAKLELQLRLVPADDKPADPVVLDDIMKLIRQAVATVNPSARKVVAPAEGFGEPTDDAARDLRAVESKVKHRIEQADADAQTAVRKRAETASLPDGAEKLAAESLAAAERVVSAFQRAIVRGVAVRLPDAPPPTSTT